ncbi:DDE-type integrase/transposase/recombinase [Halomonas cupida]|uniref:integrase catalytic domain-containing protein n=1 Tax=Halomonas cupida TaxID=44933 RepID=UPI003FCD393B
MAGAETASGLPPSCQESAIRCLEADLTHVWCGKDRRASLAVIIGCCTREILGWRLSDNGSSKNAEAALEEALIYRLGARARSATASPSVR